LIWNKQEVLKNNYISENEFDDNLSELKENYEIKSLYEPYYCFYFWLRRKGNKILFLEATTPFIDDNITTMIMDANGQVLLYHTWYARSYGSNDRHTKRINKIFELLEFENKVTSESIIFKHRTFFIIKRVRKLYQRIRMRIQIIRNIEYS